jgi:hypothetical protein
VTESIATDRLRAALAALIDDSVLAMLGGRSVALGWATVELDRAAVELGAALGRPPEAFVDSAPTTSLGARCRIAPDGLGPGVAVVLLEPSTEGRLAASLARHGQGPMAVWLGVTALHDGEAILRRAAIAISAPDDGPFGLERLLLDGPIHGPHRLVVELAGTIRP